MNGIILYKKVPINSNLELILIEDGWELQGFQFIKGVPRYAQYAKALPQS